MMKRNFLLSLLALANIFLLAPACKKKETNDDINPNPPTGVKFNVSVSTFAGSAGAFGYVDGPGSSARFNGPGQLVFDHRNQLLYVADQGYDGLVIRAVDPQGNVSTYVPQDASTFTSIGDLCLAPGPGGNLYMTSTENDAVYKITKNTTTGQGDVVKISGFNHNGNSNGNSIASATFDGPKGCVTDQDGNLLVANDYYNTIKKLSFTQNKVTAFAGKPALQALDPGDFVDGPGDIAQFSGIHDMALSGNGKFLIVPDYSNHALRRININDNTVSTLFGDPIRGIDTDGPFSKAQAGNPEVAVVDKHNNVFFSSFLPGLTGGSKIRVAVMSEQKVYTIAGGQGPGSSRYRDGTGVEARFNGIKGIALTADEKTLFVSDRYNHCIRKIALY